MEWQPETNQFVVMYDNAQQTKTLSARYNVGQITQAQPEASAEDLGRSTSQRDKQRSNVCSYCGISGNNLGKCAKCRVARYCSPECQARDWKAKHREDCKELRTSRKPGDKKKHMSTSSAFRVAISREPWFFEHQFLSSKMCVYKDKLIVSGFLQGMIPSPVMVYDIATGMKEAEVCSVARSTKAIGHSVISFDSATYTVVSLSFERFELWPYPTVQSKPVYIFSINSCSPAHTFHDGRLLLADAIAMVIREFDANGIPFLSTGKVIKTDLAIGNIVYKMCVFRRNSEKNILLMYSDLSDHMSNGQMFFDRNTLLGTNLKGVVVKCIDYSGKSLWKLENHRLDGTLINPTDVCANDSGYIFIADGFNFRIVVLHCERVIQSIETLFETPGKVVNIEWRKDTNQLVVMCDNPEDTKTMTICVDVTERSHANAKTTKPWNPRKSLEATVCGKPVRLEADEIGPDRMCFDAKKFVMGGMNVYDGTYSPIFVFSRTTGARERILCRIPHREAVNDLSLVNIGGATYVVVSIFGKYKANKFQLWPWPAAASEPVYTYTVPRTSSSVHFHEDRLLVYDRRGRTIDEYDVSSIPFKSTGFQIKTDLVPGDFVLNMCITKEENGDKRLVVLYRQEVDETDLKV